MLSEPEISIMNRSCKNRVTLGPSRWTWITGPNPVEFKILVKCMKY